MPVSDTQLLLRLSADVAKFQKQMARITKAGTDASTAVENRFRSSNQKMAHNAEQSAAAIGREMDRLRSKYNPLFAASKRYEAELAELNRAQKVGALSTQQYEAALENLNAEYARSTGQAQRMGAATRQITTQSRGMGGGIQDVAFQIGDFATQVGAGTAASVALGQQLPQLLGGFGALGAVLGAVVAVGVPLAASMFDLGLANDDVKDATERLSDAVDEYVEASKRASLPTEEMAEKYGTATAAAREFLSALQDISNHDQLVQLDKAMEGIATRFGQFSMAIRGDGMSVGGTAYEETLRSIQRELDVTGREALQIVDALRAVDAAEGPQEAVDAIQDLLGLLEDTLGPFEEMNAAGQEIYRSLKEAGVEAAEMVGAGDAMSVSIRGAASEAGLLADELGRAVENAISLAAQGIQDVKRAQIEYEYRDDPVGKARAIASETFDTRVGDTSGADPIVQEALAAEREEFVQASVAAEEYRQKLVDWRKEQAAAAAESARGSRGSRRSGSGSRGGREQPGLFEASDRELQQMERRLEMIGMTSAEIVELEARYRLLDEARERGLSLDARASASGETLREQIDRQASAIGELSAEYEQASERAAYLDGVNADLKDGFLEAITAGESLSGVLEDLARSLAKALLQASLFNEGPFSRDGGGTGLLGGIVGAIFGGGGTGGAEAGSAIAGALNSAITGRAAGGPVRAGQIVKVGEHGPEPFIPSVNGRVLSTAQAQEALRGGGGAAQGRVQVEVTGGELMISDNGELMQRVRVTARDASAGAVKEYDSRVLPGRFGSDGSMRDPRRRGGG